MSATRTAGRAAIAAALAGGAAGWVLAGVFDTMSARALGVLVPALGAALGWLITTRWRANALSSYLPLPAALVAGFAAMWPESGGPRLIAEALQSGGISQPPVPFDPGWRFFFVAVLVVVSAVSVLLGEARLSPLPGAAVVLLGVLVQPPGGALVAVAGGLVLLAASLAVAVGGDEDVEGAGAFEARRLLRGGGALAGLVALLVVLSQFGFLFPDSEGRQVIPPKRPQPPPEQPQDRVLFRVKADRPMPLRLGVLDVYDGRGFLTPPYDSARFERLRAGAVDSPDAVRVEVTVEDLGGHVLPAVASPVAITAKGAKVEVDPRTQQLRLPKARARKGLRYTVAGAPVPSAEALEAAPPPPASYNEFLDVPEPPPVVQELLANAPTGSYSRLQYLRTALYTRVVAAGAGNPVDVPPGRVAELLDGKEASPFEITAAEVLLARWAGVPARLGYGYYDPQGAAEIRPRNGATWLEAYFEGHGWVPVVGSPPRAKSSFNRAPKKDDPLVRPTDDLALVVYVPVRLTTVQLLYTYVRWWAARLVPAAAGVALLWALVPAALRLVRRWRRRRWATTPARKVLVAYAELRDTAADLNIGAPGLTPLEFVSAVAPDDEHTQLAWLVTRGLWGDLRRDLTDDDVRAAEDMAASVTRRLRRAQPFPTRAGALASRASLRAPWSSETPNVRVPRLPRPRLRGTGGLRGGGRRLLRLLRPARAAAIVAALALALLTALVALSPAPAAVEKAQGAGGAVADAAVIPGRVGDVELRPEPAVEEAYAQAGASSIVSRGQVWSVRRGDDLEGSLQVATLKAGVNANDAEVRRAVVRSIGRGQFRLTRVGPLRAYALQLPEQRFLLWFAPDGQSFHLLVTRSSFEQADRVLVAAATGAVDATSPAASGVLVPDPRRGAPQ